MALALLFSEDRRIALIFLGAMAFSFVALRLVARGIEWLARRAPKPRSTELRMALGNIHRPGSLTPSVVLSLGLGLTLLVTLALIDGNLRNQVTGQPAEAGADLLLRRRPEHRDRRFRKRAGASRRAGKVDRSADAARAHHASEGRPASPSCKVAARGQLGAARRSRHHLCRGRCPRAPRSSRANGGRRTMPASRWCRFAAEEARELGLKIGDTITVNVLGRNITAQDRQSARRSSGESMSINFVMVFSPNTFAGAPHAWLATLSLTRRGDDDQARDGRILRRRHQGLSGGHERPGQGCARDRQHAGRPTGDRDPGGCGGGAHRLAAGAGRRARGRKPHAHPRCGGAEDAGRDARTLIMRSFVLEYALLGPCHGDLRACWPAASPPGSWSRGSWNSPSSFHAAMAAAVRLVALRWC